MGTLQKIDSNQKYLLTPFHAFLEKKYAYAIYKYKPGGTLADLLDMYYYNTGINDEVKIARIIKDVLCGLQFMHNNKYTHRMINPKSIHLCQINGISMLTKVHYILKLDKHIRNKSNFVIKRISKSETDILNDDIQHLSYFAQKFIRLCRLDRKYQQYMDPEILKCYNKNETEIDTNIWYANDIYAIGVLCIELKFGLLPHIKFSKELFGSFFIHEKIKLKSIDNYNKKISKNFYDFIKLCHAPLKKETKC